MSKVSERFDPYQVLLASTRANRNEPNVLRLQHAVRRGLPFGSVRAVARDAGLDIQAVLVALRVSPSARTRLSADESDRLWRFARLLEQAEDVLGDMERARTWFTRPNRALDGLPPLDLVDTDIGARRIEESLDQLKYGVFA